MQAKVLRAIYSERQLEEVMTDFWFNHFNVFVGKGPERLFLTNYEQDVIRPHALGKFEDLLVATAKSPAMLFYLDNWMSEGPNSLQGLGIPEHPSHYTPHYPPGSPYVKRKQNNGLNENYGRELLELHTLSVNGGYSQRDVTEVAKVFTGWTIDKPYEGLGFKYDPRMHEPGPKFVLGHRIKPKGEDEGKEVLHMLATSPQTAHFISLKLAAAFRGGRSAARAGRSHGKNFPEKERRHPRSSEHAVPFAGILGRRRLSRQSENAARVRGLEPCAPPAPMWTTPCPSRARSATWACRSTEPSRPPATP